MSEISTADLAGGTRPRADEHDTVTERPMDARRHPGETDEGLGLSPSQREMSDEHRAATPDPATPTPASSSTGVPAGDTTPLFPTGEAEGFRSRWSEIQTGFVDEPRRAVEQADGLVAEMMQRLAQVFADERSKLEEQWSRGDDISTEDLRVALQRYRSFFSRLLSI